MISVVLFVLIILSVHLYLSVVREKTYSETIPVTCSAIVLILFLAGLCGKLLWGFYLIEFIAFVLLCCVVVTYFKKKDYEYINPKNVFDSRTTVFLISVILICWGMYGKLFDVWDEFSHWGDSVWVMSSLDDYVTNENSFSLVKSYPPGMGLFQYCLEKIYQQINGKDFAEWLTYVAYQIFVVAFMIPVFSFRKSRIWSINVVTTLLTIFIAPLMFGEVLFEDILIDTFLGILFACGMSAFILMEKCSLQYILYECSVCMMLVLAKDAGLLFAVFLVVAIGMDVLLDKHMKMPAKSVIVYLTMLVLSVGLPKILWATHLEAHNISRSDSVPYDFNEICDIVAGRASGTYRIDVYNNFIKRITTAGIQIGEVVLPDSFLVLGIFLLTIAIEIVLYNLGKTSSKKIIIASIVELFVSIVYLVGLLFVYMYKLGDFEGPLLASYQRYTDILYEAIWLIFVSVLCFCLDNIEKKYWRVLSISLAIGGMMIVEPMGTARDYVTREIVSRSNSFRGKYQFAEKIISRNCDEDDVVWVVSQGDIGWDRMVIGSIIRPVRHANVPYSIGDTVDDGDGWNVQIEVEELKEELQNENVNYLYIQKLDDRFFRYQEIFCNPDEIKEWALYRFQEDGKFRLVEEW